MSDSFISTHSGPSKGPQKRSASTWEHSRAPDQPREPTHSASGKYRLWYCKYCPAYTATSTTNARKHLLSHHQIDANKSAPSLSRLEVSVDKINKALVYLIVRHNLSFRAVEWPAMRTLLSLGGLNMGISSHTSVTNYIEKLWAAAKDDIRIRLQSSLSVIHIAADIWTSPNRHLFLGVCAHFVDRETSQLVRILLGLRPVLTHRGDEQAQELFHVFQDFGIAHKVGYFIGDNHAANDVLCRSLEARFI